MARRGREVGRYDITAKEMQDLFNAIYANCEDCQKLCLPERPDALCKVHLDIVLSHDRVNSLVAARRGIGQWYDRDGAGDHKTQSEHGWKAQRD